MYQSVVLYFIIFDIKDKYKFDILKEMRMPLISLGFNIVVRMV